MQLHRLTMQAIGPFPGRHTIDFERLGASGLFLLEGPTGSGKSTVIDAVVFALYGQVAGADASNDRMHSDFAAPHVEPFVQLDFQTSSGLYRVLRTPKHERPKARGTGTTTQNATATLWRLVSPDAEPDDDAVATSVSEVGAEIARAVGLSRAQFVKTVVLPQGEFAAFLRAGAEERRELLQRLFGTELYERVQQRMEEQRRAASAQRSEADLRVREAVASFGGAVGLDQEAEAALEEALGDADGLTGALTLHVAAVRALEATAAERRSAADTAAESTEQRLRAAQQHEERRITKAALQGEQADLEAAAADQLARLDRLERAERSARVAATLDGVREASDRAATAEAALVEVRAELEASLRPLDPAAWEAEERRRREAAASLRQLVAMEGGLPDREAELSQVELHRAELQRRLAEIDETLVLLPERRGRLRAQEETAAVRAADVQASARELATAQDRLAASEQADSLRQQLAAAAAQQERARGLAERSQHEEHRLRRRYIDGMAGQLAVGLTDGDPCPVCGSTAHPSPARPAPDAVSAADVDRAEQVRTVAVASLEEAAAGHAEVVARLAAAEAVAAALAPAAARAAVTTAELAHAEAELARADLERLRAEAAAAEEEQRAGEQERSQVLQGLAAADVDLDARRGALDVDRMRLAEARGDDPSVAERVGRLGREASALAAVRGAAQGAAAADADLVARRRQAVAVAADHGFGDPDEAAAARLPAGEQQALAAAAADHDTAVTEVSARLADPHLADVEVSDVRDVVPLAAEHEAAVEQARSAQAEHARVQLRHAAAEERRAAVAAALVHQRAVAHAMAPVIRMANLVTAHSADNVPKMTLATFVLLERFGDVVAAANQRLDVMSDSRYRLEHVMDKEGGRRSGLGLVVRDNHTEKARPPATLSGGETFYCSLALALGLADVVTAEAGGIDLGTLFVDEGFGTLDPDTLEQVIGVLSGLRAGGRTVGIVSHVAELKDRISERVEVRRSPDGSSRLEVVA